VELALETHGLTRRFGNLVAVDHVDISVPVGSFYGFLGPNGAGKSTTIACLNGLLRPSEGEVRILGLDPIQDPVAVKRQVGVVPEDLALLDRLSAVEMLRFIGQVYGLGPATIRQRAEQLLGLMDLDRAADGLVTDYSHGMKKKLALAAALLPAPRLLFLDEPFEGIDAVASRQIRRLLRTYVDEGGTIFFTSHILEIVERLSDRIGVIADGRLVAQGSLDELRRGGAEGRTLEELFIDLVGGEDVEAPELDWLSA